MENENKKPTKPKNNMYLKLNLSILVILVVITASASVFYFTYKPKNVAKPEPESLPSSTINKNLSSIKANNQFAFELYPKLDDGSNLFYSPFSISSAMAMVYDGAKGETANEIKSAFHYPTDSELKNDYLAIQRNLNQQNSSFELKTANALWLQKDYRLLPTYTNTATNYFGAKITNLDFKNSNQESAKAINDYTSNLTNNKVTNIVGDSVSIDTKLIITNAIYFKGDWQSEFDKNFTTKNNFYASKTAVKSVDMMSKYNESFNYYGDDKLQIIEIPYKDNKLSMLAILPKGNLDSIKSLLASDQLEKYKTQMNRNEITTLKIPKIEFKTDYNLIDPLEKLGIKTAFTNNADFTGITSKRELSINSVLHKAYIKIDEQGTEAAAATSAGMNVTSVKEDDKSIINFIADHPYIFLIQDNETGNILFFGKISDPTI